MSRTRISSSVVLGGCLALITASVVLLGSVQAASQRHAVASATQRAAEQRLIANADAFEADLRRVLRLSGSAFAAAPVASLLDAAALENAALLRTVLTLQDAPEWRVSGVALEQLRRLLQGNQQRLADAARLRGASGGATLANGLAADSPQLVSAAEALRAGLLDDLAGRAAAAERQRASLAQLEVVGVAGLVLVLAGCALWVFRLVLQPLRRFDRALRVAAERGMKPDVVDGGSADLARIASRTSALVQAAEDRSIARIAALRDELDVQRERRQQLEEACEVAAQSIRANSDYVERLGHELRTPLNGMLGLLDLLATDVKGEQAQRRLQSIQGSARLLRDVLDQMSDAAAGTAASPSSEPALLSGPEPLPGARVLVAEDHSINQMVITEMLEYLGHIVEVVPDGLRAVQRVRDRLFDVVLMDWSMPELDGVEATRLIRAEEARTGRPRVPIIALTAHTYAENRRECLEAGMDDFLAKPVTVDGLEAAIRRAVA